MEFPEGISAYYAIKGNLCTQLYKTVMLGCCSYIAQVAYNSDLFQPQFCCAFKQAADLSESSDVNGQLFSAADRGDVNKVEEKLLQGADINFQHCAGTPLTRAARRGHLECVEFLLDRGADINLSGNFNFRTCTALHAAASNGHFSVVKLLLDRGANVNASTGTTPLHDAATFGHQNIVELLLQREADKDSVTSYNQSALQFAVSKGKLKGLRWVLEAAIEYYFYRRYFYNKDFFPEKAVDYLFANKEQVNLLDMSDLEILRKALLGNDVEAIKLVLKERPAVDVKQRHLQLVKFLLETAIDPEIKDGDGTGLLEEAILNDDEDCVQLLVQHGIDVNRLGSIYCRETTPLHSSISWEREKILRILLENGADPNGLNPEGHTPLYAAVSSKNPEFVRMLLEHGARVDIVDKDGNTPFHEVKTMECAKLLIEHGADVRAMNKHGQSVLFSTADERGESSCVRYLIEQGLDPLLRDKKGRSALDLTIERISSSYEDENRLDRSVGCAKVLLEYGAEVDTSGESLHSAVTRCRAGLLTVLLNSEVDVNALCPKRRTTALFEAAYRYDYSLFIRLLIEKGADPNIKCNNMSPLLAALQKGSEESARLLIEAGAVINEEIFNSRKTLVTYTSVLKQLSAIDRQDENGVSLLHMLCHRGGSSNRLKALFDAGVNVNVTDERGTTPLHLVCFNGCERIVKLLLTAKVEVNRQDKKGHTPLHYAAFKGHSRVAHLLLEHGADPNIEDGEGQTVAHLAMDHLADDVCSRFLETLLRHGALSNVDNSLLHKAQTNGLTECAKLLVEEGYFASKPIEGATSEIPDLSFYSNLPQYVCSSECSSDEDSDLGFGLFD